MGIFWVRQLLHFYLLKNFIGGGFRFGRRRWLEYDNAFSSRAPLAGLATDDGPWGMWRRTYQRRRGSLVYWQIERKTCPAHFGDDNLGAIAGWLCDARPARMKMP
jgi:hypothetical protein